LWLWTTNYHMLNGAREVLDAWGFAPVTILTWAKDKFGTSSWLRGQSEHCMLATRGKPMVTLTSQSTLLLAPVRGHSVKPVEFYALVEGLCPAARYADLFSRYRHNDQLPRGRGTMKQGKEMTDDMTVKQEKDMTDDMTVEQWLAIRKEAALQIDPETAEVMWKYGHIMDPYGVDPDLPEEYQCVGRAYFARFPGGDVWVSFYDLPEATHQNLRARIEAGDFDRNDDSWLLG
jgi:MT-A70